MKLYSRDGFRFQLLPFPWIDLSSIDWEDIATILGGGNDLVGSWTFNSYTAIEGWANHRYISANAEIWLNNRGFNRGQIPPEQDPYNP